MNKEEILKMIECNDISLLSISETLEKLFILAIPNDNDKKEYILSKYDCYKRILFPKEEFNDFLEKVESTKSKYTKNFIKTFEQSINEEKESILQTICCNNIDQVSKPNLLERLFCLSLLTSDLDINNISLITTNFVNYRDIVYPEIVY